MTAMRCLSKMSRRRVLRGMLGGAAVTVGLPLLDCFLDSNGAALAAGAPLPPCFGTWFYGCGLNPVSYTHLDVYKRQALIDEPLRCALREGLPGAQVKVFPDYGHNPFCLLYTSRCV